jgi:hypothetical protein
MSLLRGEDCGTEDPDAQAVRPTMDARKRSPALIDRDIRVSTVSGMLSRPHHRA